MVVGFDFTLVWTLFIAGCPHLPHVRSRTGYGCWSFSVTDVYWLGYYGRCWPRAAGGNDGPHLDARLVPFIATLRVIYGYGYATDFGWTFYRLLPTLFGQFTDLVTFVVGTLRCYDVTGAYYTFTRSHGIVRLIPRSFAVIYLTPLPVASCSFGWTFVVGVALWPTVGHLATFITTLI